MLPSTALSGTRRFCRFSCSLKFCNKNHGELYDFKYLNFEDVSKTENRIAWQLQSWRKLGGS